MEVGQLGRSGDDWGEIGRALYARRKCAEDAIAIDVRGKQLVEIGVRTQRTLVAVVLYVFAVVSEGLDRSLRTGEQISALDGLVADVDQLTDDLFDLVGRRLLLGGRDRAADGRLRRCSGRYSADSRCWSSLSRWPKIGLICRDVRLVLRVLRDLLHQFDAVFSGRRIVAG